MEWNLRNHLVAAEFTAAVEALDVPELERLLAPEATGWFNFMGPEGASVSREDAIANILNARKLMTDFRYITTSREVTESGYWQTGRIRSITNSGAVVDMPVALIAEVNGDGRITGYREWLDSVDVVPLFQEMSRARAI